MQKFIVSFFILSQCTIGYAQSAVTGKIIDSTNTPVPYTVVALLQQKDSAIVKGTLTDEKGIFVLNDISPGKYFLKISASGYETNYFNSITKDSISDFIIPDISLTHLKIQDAVTIASITPTVEFKNGNITVNVEDSPLARGNSVYDLLYKLPGVSIENNMITIQGKSGVIFMIDGRIQQMSNEQLLNMLKGMSAATIQKIEVLKNPPVKYDAAGTSGMINIVTKKSTQKGFNGTVYTESSQGFYNNTSYGVALNYKNEKISVFTALDGIYNTYQVQTKLYSNFSNDSGITQLANLTGYKVLETGLTFKLGAIGI